MGKGDMEISDSRIYGEGVYHMVQKGVIHENVLLVEWWNAERRLGQQEARLSNSAVWRDETN